MSADRRIAFGVMARPTGLRMVMRDALSEGVERLEDESYEVVARGGSVYGFWIQDLANSLAEEANRI